MEGPAKPDASANPSSGAPELARNSAFSKESLSVIDLSSSDSDSSDDSNEFSEAEILGIIGNKAGEKSLLNGDALSGLPEKSRKTASNELGVVLPEGPLRSIAPAEEPIPVLVAPPECVLAPVVATPRGSAVSPGGSYKQFWKAGDYEGAPSGDWDLSSGGMDHVRVHPKFLHSNATSHKWALGAFAELLDNSLDEVCYGATYVNVDMIENRKDGSRMLLVEDDGGGMNPEKLRHCMSLGYSAKSKLANTIGQYGNGFKTSTMRLGADVIVFSRCCGKDGRSPTQSIGLLSYTFLRSTGKEDIVVPMLDYERRGPEWAKIIRSSVGDWNNNVDTIVQWSPFSSEADLLHQFNLMKDHGTRILIYNLWEDDHGMLELDFDADPRDIQLRGVNRDEKNIKMASQFPNSRHFLTYKHSLRSYASILYLRLPPGFRIILRGKDVEHHNIVNDMMQSEKVTYRPQYGADGNPVDSNMAAVVTIGFVKDAKNHIDVQGFNVYHKNRLIKPFWRIWNAAGSDGRGVIGVLEANFVEPAHDKQGFERTTVLSRLESRLVQMQKNYWTTNCHKIGYAPRRSKKLINGSASREASPEVDAAETPLSKKRKPSSVQRNPYSSSSGKHGGKASVSGTYKGSSVCGKGGIGGDTPKTAKRGSSIGPSSPLAENISDDDDIPERTVHGNHQKGTHNPMFGSESRFLLPSAQENRDTRDSPSEGDTTKQLQEAFQREKERCRALESEVEEAKQKIEELNKEQESLIDIFSEERERRDKEEEALRKKLKEASNTIQELLEKIKVLEKANTPNRRR